MPDPGTAPSPKAIKAAAAFKRGFLSLNFKFSALTGGLLSVLLIIVTLVVNAQLRSDLTREVAERGNTVARNVSVKASDLLLSDDPLAPLVLLKDSVEDATSVTAAPPEGLAERIWTDLQASLGGRAEVKNEGISRILLIKNAKDPSEKPTIIDSASSLGQDVVLPDSKADPDNQEPYPIFEDKGKKYYDIAQPVVVIDPLLGVGKTVGQVRLFLRKDIITDAVRVATTRLVAVMLLSLLLGTIGLFVVVQLLMRPVGALVKGVNAVAAGDFNIQIGIKRGDELGDLVDAYNGMAKSLKEKEAIQEALAKYTSKDLVNQMLTDKGKLELGGKRVHATIFFSVVRGMHALSQDLPAEEFVALVNEYLEVETDTVMKNGGSIDKFIGDEVMAVWGLNGEDPTEMAYQATKAAVETQDAIAKLNSERVAKGEQPFLVSIGVNNGEVVSGNMGSSVKMDFTVLGANVNLAARLGLVAAQGGQSIISHSVYSLVADRFKIDRLAPMQLKGIKEPVPLYWPRKILK